MSSTSPSPISATAAPSSPTPTTDLPLNTEASSTIPLVALPVPSQAVNATLKDAVHNILELRTQEKALSSNFKRWAAGLTIGGVITIAVLAIILANGGTYSLLFALIPALLTYAHSSHASKSEDAIINTLSRILPQRVALRESALNELKLLESRSGLKPEEIARKKELETIISLLSPGEAAKFKNIFDKACETLAKERDKELSAIESEYKNLTVLPTTDMTLTPLKEKLQNYQTVNALFIEHAPIQKYVKDTAMKEQDRVNTLLRQLEILSSPIDLTKEEKLFRSNTCSLFKDLLIIQQLHV